MLYSFAGAASAAALAAIITLTASNPGPLTVSLQNMDAPVIDGQVYWAGAPYHHFILDDLQQAEMNPLELEQVEGGAHELVISIRPQYQQGGGKVERGICYGVGCEPETYVPVFVARPQSMGAQSLITVPVTVDGPTTVRVRAALDIEGFGSKTTGGRNAARIYEVTSTVCSGEGGIRDGLLLGQSQPVYINYLLGGESPDCTSENAFQVAGRDITIYALAAPTPPILRGSSLWINPQVGNACIETGNILVAGLEIDRLRSRSKDFVDEALRIEMGSSGNTCSAISRMGDLAFIANTFGNCTDDCVGSARGNGRIQDWTFGLNRIWSSVHGMLVSENLRISAYLNVLDGGEGLLRSPMPTWASDDGKGTSVPFDQNGERELVLHFVNNAVFMGCGSSLSQIMRGGTAQFDENGFFLTECAAGERRLPNQHLIACGSANRKNVESNLCTDPEAWASIGRNLIWSQARWQHHMAFARVQPTALGNVGPFSAARPLSVQRTALQAMEHAIYAGSARSARDIARLEILAQEIAAFPALTTWTDDDAPSLDKWGDSSGLALDDGGYRVTSESPSLLFKEARQDDDQWFEVGWIFEGAPSSNLTLFYFADAAGNPLGAMRLTPSMAIEVFDGNQRQRVAGNRALQIGERYDLRLVRRSALRLLSGGVEGPGIDGTTLSMENPIQNTSQGQVAQIVFLGYDTSGGEQPLIISPCSTTGFWCSQGGGTQPPEPVGPTGPTGPTGPLPPTADFSGEFIGKINDDGNVVLLELNVTEQQE